MIILGLNTATNLTQIAIVKRGEKGAKILAEYSWKSEQNEAEKLLPSVIKLLKKAKLDWSELGAIAVVKGPGPFTALRISVAVANAIAYALNLPIFGIKAQDFWEFRTHDTDCDFALNAGLNKVFYKGKIVEFDHIIHGLKQITGHLKESQINKLKQNGVEYVEEKNLKSLADFLSIYSDYKDEKLVKPEYFAPPTITKSSKSYK